MPNGPNDRPVLHQESAYRSPSQPSRPDSVEVESGGRRRVYPSEMDRRRDDSSWREEERRPHGRYRPSKSIGNERDMATAPTASSRLYDTDRLHPLDSTRGSKSYSGSGSNSGDASPAGERSLRYWHLCCQATDEEDKMHYYIEVPERYTAARVLQKTGLAFEETDRSRKSVEGRERPYVFSLLTERCTHDQDREEKSSHANCAAPYMASQITDDEGKGLIDGYLVHKVDHEDMAGIWESAKASRSTVVIPYEQWTSPGWVSARGAQATALMSQFRKQDLNHRAIQTFDTRRTLLQEMEDAISALRLACQEPANLISAASETVCDLLASAPDIGKDTSLRLGQVQHSLERASASVNGIMSARADLEWVHQKERQATTVAHWVTHNFGTLYDETAEMADSALDDKEAHESRAREAIKILKRTLGESG